MNLWRGGQGFGCTNQGNPPFVGAQERANIDRRGGVMPFAMEGEIDRVWRHQTNDGDFYICLGQNR